MNESRFLRIMKMKQFVPFPLFLVEHSRSIETLKEESRNTNSLYSNDTQLRYGINYLNDKNYWFVKKEADHFQINHREASFSNR